MEAGRASRVAAVGADAFGVPATGTLCARDVLRRTTKTNMQQNVLRAFRSCPKSIAAIKRLTAASAANTL